MLFFRAAGCESFGFSLLLGIMGEEGDKSNDFYAVLGLNKECTDSELRNAYKKLALVRIECLFVKLSSFSPSFLEPCFSKSPSHGSSQNQLFHG